jgi:diacylglycerol kinase (ATP)
MINFFSSRFRSFGYAIKGLKEFFSTQLNAWIEIAASLVVIIAGIYFDISANEWLAVIYCIGLVFTAEIINTSIEYLCNLVSPDFNPLVGKVKDLASAAVLVASIISLIVAVVIFWKYVS